MWNRESSEQEGKMLSESPAAQSKEPVIVTFQILCHLKSISPDLLSTLDPLNAEAFNSQLATENTSQNLEQM